MGSVGLVNGIQVLNCYKTAAKDCLNLSCGLSPFLLVTEDTALLSVFLCPYSVDFCQVKAYFKVCFEVKKFGSHFFHVNPYY